MFPGQIIIDRQCATPPRAPRRQSPFVKRGLNNYLVEMTEDPTGATGWHVISTPTKSSLSVTGLTSRERYWFRVSANGAAGSGPASEAATKVAP